MRACCRWSGTSPRRGTRQTSAPTLAALDVLRQTAQAAGALLVMLDSMHPQTREWLTAAQAEVTVLVARLKRPQLDDPLAYGLALLADRVRTDVPHFPHIEDRSRARRASEHTWRVWEERRGKLEE